MVDPRHFKRPESVMVVVHTPEEVLVLKRADHDCFWQSVTGSLEWNEEKQQTIPANCALWFDGCNRCIVENGEVKACTKMACSLGTKVASTCLEYNK